ncbi:MAG: CPBP family intramembrane metalloprotease [Candidatus Heimdallarchaeota archaeon]|nr:CPBP family intramembrane metalloprotease [Candidatus Heimdallarchaeota archaeon]MBY8993105.1 CPBP family intramembrane metalloprotease [Candidatus Heimdallarchaeota archaeon]
MAEEIATANVEKILADVPVKELLLLCIPISIIFAVSGMDFIGWFIYLATRASNEEVYTRGILNVMLLGFLLTIVSLAVIPIVVNKVRWKKPLSYFGSQKGEYKLGLILLGAFLLATPLFYFSSKEPNLINTYPLTKDVLGRWSFFALYEMSYILFYYIPYEFYFRGILQLGLSKTWKKWQSILFVTALTTLLHLTKPWTEILAAFVFGLVFGFIAEKTKSWYYVCAIHFTAGVLTDTFCSLAFLGVIS